MSHNVIELKKREFSALAKLQEKESQIRLLQNRIGGNLISIN